MKFKFILPTIIVLIVFSSACSQTAADSMKLNPPLANTPKTTSTKEKEFPPVLLGSIAFFPDRTKLSGSTGVDKSGVTATTEAGITVKLPPIGTTIEMDVVNCAGYIGTAKVTFLGLDEHTRWKTEFLPETVVADVIERMKKCNSYFDDKLPMDSAFFIAPADEKRKHLKTKKKPDWKAVLASLPTEWRKAAELDAESLKVNNATVEDSIGWADSDGDGSVDLLELAQVDRENDTYATHSIIIRLVSGKWEKLWQTERIEKEYEQPENQ